MQQLAADYDAELRARLEKLYAAIIPVPSISHQVDLIRAMESRRPFDPEGRNGYRDVLIWRSLLEFIELHHEKIAFVAGNTKDSCTGTLPALLDTSPLNLTRYRPRRWCSWPPRWPRSDHELRRQNASSGWNTPRSTAR